MTDSLPRPLRALLPLAGRALETVLNRSLALDPGSQQALQRLVGRRLQLQLEAPPLALELHVEEGGRLRVGPAQAAEPDLHLRATLGALLGQLLPSAPGATPVGRLRISGDAELAQAVQKLAKNFDPDIDGAFAGVFGDVLGVQIARALREGLRRGREESARVARDTAEYLVEERRDVVGKSEQDAHFDAVDTLRDDVERLAARIERLRRRAGGTA
jgi:ubiquinone biosynthesis accessory factor UbiJ